MDPRVLNACAAELAEVYTDIFKKSIIITGPQEATHNPHECPLTSVAMKCLEKLVLKAMDSIIPVTTDPLQFTYRKNR